MHRDMDPREIERDRPEMPRGGRGGSDPERAVERTESRDPLTRELSLPRGRAREHVRSRDWEGELRGSEVRILATAGAYPRAHAVEHSEIHGLGRMTHLGRDVVHRHGA